MINVETIQDLLDYYLSTRGIGHTSAMAGGTDKNECVVLVAEERDVKLFQRNHPNRICVSLHRTGPLKTIKRPMLIDNHAMIEILKFALKQHISINNYRIALEKIAGRRYGNYVEPGSLAERVLDGYDAVAEAGGNNG